MAGIADRIADEVDITTPSAARLYDYYLGGAYDFESTTRPR